MRSVSDEKGKQWTYGSANTTDGEEFYILTSFLEYEGEFEELIPLNSSNGITEFQATDFSAAYRQNGNLFILGLSAFSYRDILRIWKNIESGQYAIDKIIKKKIKGEADTYIKLITGNFADFYVTFFADALLHKTGRLTKDAMHFYAYTALLKKMVRWFCGRMENDL